jgi:hypothetical protein
MKRYKQSITFDYNTVTCIQGRFCSVCINSEGWSFINLFLCKAWRHMGNVVAATIIPNLGARLGWVISSHLGHFFHFISGNIAPGTHWVRGWVGCRNGLDSLKKTKISFSCRELHHASSDVQLVSIFTMPTALSLFTILTDNYIKRTHRTLFKAI